MTVLLGQSGAGGNTTNGAGPGSAEAIKLTALATGTVDTVQFFFRTGNTVTNIHFALYADSAGSPAARISAEVILASPVANADNAITGFSVSVVSGTPYWIAWLQPNNQSGTFNYADFATSGGVVKDSTANLLTSLPDPAGAYGTAFANIVRVYATGTVSSSALSIGPVVETTATSESTQAPFPSGIGVIN